MKKSTQIKIGDFVEGKHGYGNIAGIVKELKAKYVIIDIYNQSYDDFTKTENTKSLTISRIYNINRNSANIIN